MAVSSPSMKDKSVKIPWCLADSNFIMDGSLPLNLRTTVFVAGIPLSLKASKQNKARMNVDFKKEIQTTNF